MRYGQQPGEGDLLLRRPRPKARGALRGQRRGRGRDDHQGPDRHPAGGVDRGAAPPPYSPPLDKEEHSVDAAPRGADDRQVG